MDRIFGMTYNEAAVLFIYGLLQRCLVQVSGVIAMTTLMTNLILNHGISDVLNHTSKLIHVFSIFQEPGHRASLCQCGEVFQDNIQFPGYPSN